MSIYGPNGGGADDVKAELMDYVDRMVSAVTLQFERNVLLLDGTSRPVRHLPMHGKKIVALGDPSDDGDASTKRYVDRRIRSIMGYQVASSRSYQSPTLGSTN